MIIIIIFCSSFSGVSGHNHNPMLVIICVVPPSCLLFQTERHSPLLGVRSRPSLDGGKMRASVRMTRYLESWGAAKPFANLHHRESMTTDNGKINTTVSAVCIGANILLLTIQLCTTVYGGTLVSGCSNEAVPLPKTRKVIVVTCNYFLLLLLITFCKRTRVCCKSALLPLQL